MNLNKIKKEFQKLSFSVQQELIEDLSRKVLENRPILNHRNKLEKCPHCGHDKFHKHGKYKNGGSRFLCVGCKRTFNELTGTSVHGLKKKHLLSEYIEHMFNGLSLLEIEERMEISARTAFRWRHKILTSFDELFTKEFKGIVETDDIYFRLNQKGRQKNFITRKRRMGRNGRMVNLSGTSGNSVAVQFTMDRYKTFESKVIKLGNSSFDGLKRVIDTTRYNDENVVVSDNSNTIRKFFRELGINHKYFTFMRGERVVDEIYHINNLNNTVGRMKKWIGDNFSNVSTKYLSHYMNWFLLLEILKNKEDQTRSWWDYMLSDDSSYSRNLKTEGNYQLMLSQ